MNIELTDQELQNVTGGSNFDSPAYGIVFTTNSTNAGPAVNASNTTLSAGSGSLFGFATANGVANSLNIQGPLHFKFSNGFSQSSGTAFGINKP